MQKADKESIKRHNKRVLLNHLRDHDLSRTDLAAASRLSNSTVSMLIGELKAENIVFEKTQAASSGGRKPIILSLNPDAAYTLLLKLTPYQLTASLVNLKLGMVYERAYGGPLSGEWAVTEALNRALGDVMRLHSDRAARIVGVGVSVPGIVSHSDNRIVDSSTLNLRDYDIGAVIASVFPCRLFVFKDTEALLLGEYRLNRLQADKSYLYILVDTGVGLSFMSGGRLLKLNHSGLEIGHVILEPDGPLCACGSRGCVEAFLSEHAARRELGEITARRGGDKRKAEEMGFAEIIARANGGDAACGEVIAGQCAYLSRVTALAVNLFSPDGVIVGGPIGAIAPERQRQVEQAVRSSVLDYFRAVGLRFAGAEDEAGFIGMSGELFESEYFSPEESL